jgi:hypothetical protein
MVYSGEEEVGALPCVDVDMELDDCAITCAARRKMIRISMVGDNIDQLKILEGFWERKGLLSLRKETGVGEVLDLRW